jgi:hypothetical protein
MGVSGHRYPWGRYPVPILQETGWTPEPVWTGAENITTLTGIRSSDSPARSEVSRLSYGIQYYVLLGFQQEERLIT